jgi:hypothetical protein
MNPGTVQICTPAPGFFQQRNVTPELLQHDIEQRTVHFQPTVIVSRDPPHNNEVNSSSGRTGHFRQGLLAYLRTYVLRSPFSLQSGPAIKGSGPTSSQQN